MLNKTPILDISKIIENSSQDQKNVENFFMQIVQNAKENSDEFGLQYLQRRLKGATFIADVDGTFNEPKKEINCTKDFDQFLVDIHKRDIEVVLVSGHPEQKLESEIFETKLNDENTDHPILYKREFSDVGLVMFGYEDEELQSKALSVANAPDLKNFLASWNSLSELQKDQSLQPIKQLDDDIENFWKQMDALLQDEIVPDKLADTIVVPWIFSADPDYPFYNFARKIKSTPTEEMNYVDLVQPNTDDEPDTFAEKILEEQNSSSNAEKILEAQSSSSNTDVTPILR